jgi:hypothetical protein
MDEVEGSDQLRTIDPVRLNGLARQRRQARSSTAG